MTVMAAGSTSTSVDFDAAATASVAAELDWAPFRHEEQACRFSHCGPFRLPSRDEHDRDGEAFWVRKNWEIYNRKTCIMNLL